MVLHTLCSETMFQSDMRLIIRHRIMAQTKTTSFGYQLGHHFGESAHFGKKIPLFSHRHSKYLGYGLVDGLMKRSRPIWYRTVSGEPVLREYPENDQLFQAKF